MINSYHCQTHLPVFINFKIRDCILLKGTPSSNISHTPNSDMINGRNALNASLNKTNEQMSNIVSYLV